MTRTEEMKRARQLDQADPLSSFREEFHLPPDTIYLNGNSLGLMSQKAQAALEAATEEWRDLAVRGWSSAPRPWLETGERLGREMEGLLGADPGEVVVTGTTTVNIHALVASFYRPQGPRSRILATALDFPSDIYALEGQLVLRHGPWGKELLVKAPSPDGWTVREEDIISLMTEEVALAFLPSVHYGSGQLMDLERLSGEAGERGIILGLDLCHSVGVMPHHLSEWGVDFALWCGYKWLNGGPGAPAGLYVSSRHQEIEPRLPGWWGYLKEEQFLMRHQFRPAAGAGGFQISSPPILSAAPLEGALSVTGRAGIGRIREKSLGLTGFLMELHDRRLEPLGFSLVTPREEKRRGGHVALSHPRAWEVNREMDRRGVVADFREPSVIRLAPSPLYTSYTQLCQAVDIIEEAARSLEGRS